MLEDDVLTSVVVETVDEMVDKIADVDAVLRTLDEKIEDTLDSVDSELSNTDDWDLGLHRDAAPMLT